MPLVLGGVVALVDVIVAVVVSTGYLNCYLWSLYFGRGNRVMLLFIAFLEERECVEKLGRTKIWLVSTFPICNVSPPQFSHQNKIFIIYIFFRNWAVRNPAGTRLDSLAWSLISVELAWLWTKLVWKCSDTNRATTSIETRCRGTQRLNIQSPRPSNSKVMT